MNKAPEPWWKTAVVYQVYPRSFADSTGSGVGDLDGIRTHLDHLVDLGVDALWLSPIYRSPMADAGYDVADHCDVDPLFGDLASFDLLLLQAHERGLRVMLDWVPNHTSDQHPWFLEARRSRDSAYRDWYVWRDGPPDTPPNNWSAAFGTGPAWTYDERTAQWYLHLFLPQQPDLDWCNPAVQKAMHDVLRFWLDRGVDGFRADVVHLIGKDPSLPDHPPGLVGTSVVETHDQAVTHELLRGIRSLLDSYPGDRAMVGEVNLRSPAQLATYYGHDDELQLVFNFSLLDAPWDADAWRTVIEQSLAAFEPVGGRPVWVLSNHDTPRHRSRYGGSEQRARSAAVLLLTLPGTPFLYAGEELGLEDAVVPEEQRVDPGGRDGCRAPLPWKREPPHGWPAKPWLPFAPDAAERSVEAQRDDPGSVLHLYRRLLALRRSAPDLQTGGWRPVEAPPGVLAYQRGERHVVVANLGNDTVDVPVGQELVIAVSSDGGREGEPWSGVLAADTAVVLRPRSEPAPTDDGRPT